MKFSKRPLILTSVLASTLALSACMSPPQTTRQAPMAKIDFPPMKLFRGTSATAQLRANSAIARDFIDLTFQLENGVQLKNFTRFEGPITLRVKGDVIPTSLNRDLERLLGRLKSEAGIHISRVSANEPASITIETVSQSDLSRRAPNTACIVAPNVSGWSEFKRSSRENLSWSSVQTRRNIAIFMPSSVAPQEIRDCLHEELAQALGPLNDLYRLSDSVFNDDNIHSILTSFDMLILRATYAAQLHSGMTRGEVEQALPAILKRLNPAGNRASGPMVPDTPRAWITSIVAAMSSGSPKARAQAAQSAVALAEAQGWTDARTGFAWFLMGRLSFGSDRATSRAALVRAREIYAASPATQYHTAHVDMQLSALALASGDYEIAQTIAARAIPVAERAENAALLASLQLTQAESLQSLGRLAEAHTVRLDSLGWARYGFGSDEMVTSRVNEIAALVH